MLVIVAVVLLCSLSLCRGDSGNFGNVTFPTSCDLVQADFNTAVAVLHSFWYTKARELFQDIIVKDPTCAIAYWGVAMTYWTPLWFAPSESEQAAGVAAVQKGRALAAGATQRERDYIEAIGAFFEHSDIYNNTMRVIMYEEKMKKIYYAYQEQDTEAQVFYPLSIVARNQVQNSRTEGNSVWPNYLPLRLSGKILETVQVYYPYHPGALHYNIHSYDVAELAPLGLHAANLYASAAPDVPHAIHMPSHIFNRLGMWSRSSVTNLKSMAAANYWNPIPGTRDSNFLHALDYGSYGMLQMAEDACVKSYIDQAVNWKVTDGGFDLAQFQHRYYIETEDWKGASQIVLYPTDGFDWSEPSNYYNYIFGFLFTKGMGYAKLGDLGNLTKTITQFELEFGKFLNGTEGRWSDFDEQVNEITIYRNTLRALQAWISGDKAAALSGMTKVAKLENNHTSIEVPLKVSSELAAELYLEYGAYEQAIQWFLETQKLRTNRFHTLFGLGKAYAGLGDYETAKKYFADLLNLCSSHTPGCKCSNRPQFEFAKNYINTHP